MYALHLIFAQLDITPLPNTPADPSRLNDAINAALVIIGSIAVLMIILAGIRYITSRGDPQSVAKAKNAIIYAVIGLIVTMVAAVVVNFVLRTI